MEATIIQPRVLKPDQKKVRRKRLVLYAAVTLAVLVLIGTGVLLFRVNSKASLSKNLSATVNNLEKTSNCNQGAKRLGSIGTKLADSAQYTRSAQEQALSYLASCTFVNGNTKQALVYARQLDSLYSQDGNASIQKRTQLTQTINYMQSYEK